jgi:hypothetical protein
MNTDKIPVRAAVVALAATLIVILLLRSGPATVTPGPEPVPFAKSLEPASEARPAQAATLATAQPVQPAQPPPQRELPYYNEPGQPDWSDPKVNPGMFPGYKYDPNSSAKYRLTVMSAPMRYGPKMGIIATPRQHWEAEVLRWESTGEDLLHLESMAEHGHYTKFEVERVMRSRKLWEMSLTSMKMKFPELADLPFPWETAGMAPLFTQDELAGFVEREISAIVGGRPAMLPRM